MQFMSFPSIARDALLALIGLCVGSFLNVVALRSLKEANWFWPPSHCPDCQHRLAPLDLLPVLSWLLLGGKCRYCKGKIAWQYPAVELGTAFVFVLVIRYFGFNFEGLGLLFFSCVLIAVTATDFKEKLIPHEITYPAMIIGLIYSAMVVQMRLLFPPELHRIERFGEPLTSALAGVGVSYILFDFLAFYGLKLYIMRYGHPDEQPEEEDESEEEREEFDPQVDTTFDIKKEPQIKDEFEVMGGGDAVMGAVIAAWLGLSALAQSLFYGFMIGTALGVTYLTIELARRGELAARKRRVFLGAIIGFVALEAAVFGLFTLTHQGDLATQTFDMKPWLGLGLVGAFVGSMVGLISGGERLSSPFPFGPALAAGAFIAMFFPWSQAETPPSAAVPPIGIQSTLGR
ncbi:MAG TPA: prepilin peptidase [Planktothrix sp.]